MGTKRDPGKYDCYANAADDEPMFVLLGRDPMAGTLVRAWAHLREAAGEGDKVVEALGVAAEMDRYARARAKVPVKLEYTVPDTRALRLRRAILDKAKEYEQKGSATALEDERSRCFSTAAVLRDLAKEAS